MNTESQYDQIPKKNLNKEKDSQEKNALSSDHKHSMPENEIVDGNEMIEIDFPPNATFSSTNEGDFWFDANNMEI